MNVTGGPDLTLSEVYEAADLISKTTDAEDANIIFGTVIDERMEGQVKITVLATGFESKGFRPILGKVARESKETLKEEPIKVPASEDLDIPAFLRRR